MNPSRPPRSFRRIAGPFAALLCAVVAMLLGRATAFAQDIPTIPLATITPVLDGSCMSTATAPEYGDGSVFEFFDANDTLSLVHLKQTATDLWVCMEAAPGTFERRAASLYVDTDNAKESVAEADDLRMRVVLLTDALSDFRGDGAGNWSPAPIPGWDAKGETGRNGESAEWRVALGVVSPKCEPFGLAVFHEDVLTVNDKFGWPGGATQTSPKTWQSFKFTQHDCKVSGKIAYVYRGVTSAAGAWKAMLEARGFTVQLIPLATLLATPLAPFDLIMVADDTGTLSGWPGGTPGVSPMANYIRAAGKPVMGLGEGGYAYFGKHGSPIGWPNGWHGPLDTVRGVNPGMSYWQNSTDFTPTFPGPYTLYTAAGNEVGIYHTPATIAPLVVVLGVEPGATDHAPLIAEKQGCNQLWGFSKDPTTMTADGKNLAVNAVLFGISNRCRPVEQPPATCVTLVKTANPPSGTAVSINSVIEYKLTLTVSTNPACALLRAELEDQVPTWTLFVPGSAGPGIAPVGGVVHWSLGPLAPGAVVTKSFRVLVTDAVCNNGRIVRNVARVATNLGVFISNVVTHPVNCPPGVPAGSQPPYAEDEITVYPYPLVTGQPTDLGVRVRNLSTETITLRVTFETSPNNFGIGIPFGTLPATGNPRIITLPPAGAIGSISEVHLNDWIPVTAGHYCIRVKIEFIPGPGQQAYPPIYTYRNLDVMENLQPGVTDVLTFSVGNPTAATADIALVVDNTCPGWVVSVSPLVLEDMAPGEVRTAQLSVIPPTDRPLGTACHIDVQGWIGDLLIGGIRKLDVPPVNLPHTNPPWLEREIVLRPDPPVEDKAGQLCIELNNPMPFPRTVSVDFSVAAFGAGIPFTPVGSLNNIVLPPTSFTEHCIPWTPAPIPGAAGLHRCILVTLRQAGFQDQYSQRNVDIRRIRLLDLSDLLDLQIPFRVGNPKPWPGPLNLQTILIGLNQQLVVPKWLPDPPPDLAPGAVYDGKLGFVLGAAFGAQAGQEVSAADMEQILAANPFTSGDTFAVEVTAQIDGETVGGFTVQLDVPLPRMYLPAVRK